MSTQRIFTPSSTMTATNVNSLGTVLSLGSIDAGNTALQLSNTGASVVLFDFATSIDLTRGQVLQPGQSVLITNGGSQTSIALQSVGNPTTVIANRGSVAVQNIF